MSLAGLLGDGVNHVEKKSYSHFPENPEESLYEPDHSKTDFGLTMSCHLARDGMYTSLGTDEHQTHGLDPRAVGSKCHLHLGGQNAARRVHT